MRRGFLVSEKNGQELRRAPVVASVVVGRTEDCDLVVEDHAISRHHVVVTARKDKFYWKDLDSRNGTFVNGARMIEGELKVGDRMEVGETVLRIKIEEVPDEAGAEETAALPSAGPRKADELLHGVYTVMNAVATVYDPCALVDRILEATVKAIRAQRGAVFLAGEADDALLPCPVYNQVHVIENGTLDRADTCDIRISGTVARRVLREGESVLFNNTEEDGELNVAESIMTLQLRSIICVPLRAKNGILGILYIDTDQARHQYTEQDMLLTTAVGNSAGLALENATMHQQLLDKQRIEQEIAHAWTIQEGFLIKEWPDTDPRFEVYGETHPAKTVGGDFYDFVQPDPDHVGVLIGDVSGKGVPAALSMAQLLAAFRLYARDMASPTEVIKALNDDFVRRTRHGTFCTLCYLYLDLTTGNVLCANAGHHPTVHIRPEDASCLGDASGPPVGILPEGPWEDTSWKVQPGDSLLLYTDGIVEARNGAKLSDAQNESESPEEFGDEALCRAAQRLGQKPACGLIYGVQQEVEEFCSPFPPHDDCTMIALRYFGGEARNPS